MPDTVISIENLSKRYLVGHRSGERERYTALRDVIAREVCNFTRKATDAFRGRQIVQGDEVEEFWALKNVSFEVKRGEVIGIIGRNGAGKSTLLKILSRITEPTEGRVRLRGRVASLLEVGTGFHPELTGRENIFLNGAILGMTRSEIRQKFDEIVAFAEVDKFLDTPVKRYSSGMYVRLAFAVAAHLETDILVVDEVLAVGDASFQQKCLAKMQDVAGHGRTVLFVSHNMTAMQALCARVIRMERGRVAGDGDAKLEIKQYLSSSSPSKLQGQHVRPGPDLTIINSAFSPNPVESRSDVRFKMEIVASSCVKLNEASLLLHSVERTRVGIIDLRPAGFPFSMEAGECLRIEAQLRSIPLVENQYVISLWIDSSSFVGEVSDFAELTVTPHQSNLLYSPYRPEVRGWVEFDSEIRSTRFEESASRIFDEAHLPIIAGI
jgi:lipopolysaccharide transport system ATP-binding protein